MKQKILYIFLALLVFNNLAAQTRIEQAQQAYEQKQFDKAAELWEAEIQNKKEAGLISADLYYNLGNAYFRLNNIARAILNYERANLYNSGDSDIRHNLEYAQTKTEDKITSANTMILSIWFNYIQNLMTSNAWGILSITLFTFFILALIMFFFMHKIQYKKIGFYVAISLFIVLIFTNIFAFKQKHKIETRNSAIVMLNTIVVTSEPSNTSKKLTTLHAGTKLEIKQSSGSWFEVQLNDGSVGWVEKNTLEII